MEATIKIDDKKTFQALVEFLKSVKINIIAKEKLKRISGKKYPLRGSVLKYANPYKPATDVKD
ncbi:MAG: hypothetical protein IIA88_12220 [Bacteroidetes bacterium]|nr:hypothetical protein [Bacteroidota bacterium]